MIKPNTEKSNSQLLATKKSLSNTHLFLHLPLTLTTNSFNSLLPLQSDSQTYFYNSLIHLDYLRMSTTDLSKSLFEHLRYLFLPENNSKTINRPSHPHPGIPKSKKYQTTIVSETGVVLRYSKRAKFKGKNTRYVYDIMIDFTGAYFANLSLLEQQELIYYLNDNFKLKCHRIDVAVDDYSKELFPVLEIRQAHLDGNYFGFKVIDDIFLKIINHQFVGTLGLGSRRSGLFIRIYTKHRNFIRWEAELKQVKAQRLFDKLASLTADKTINSLPIKAIFKALLDAAIGQIDFRDKSSVISSTNATRARTKRLPFWQECIDKIYSSIESLANSNYL